MICHLLAEPYTILFSLQFLPSEVFAFGGEIRHFDEGDKGTWQKYPAKYSQQKIVDPYPQVCPRHHKTVEAFAVKEYNHTRTHTHTRTPTPPTKFSKRGA